MNYLVGDRVERLIGRNGVQGENDSSEREYGVFAPVGMGVKNIYIFSTRMSVVTHGIGSEKTGCWTEVFMRSTRELEKGISDHKIVTYRSAFYFRWSRTRNMNDKARRIKIENLGNSGVSISFQKLREEQRGIDETEESEVDMMWRHFKRTLTKAATELCGTVRMGLERMEQHGGMKI